MDFHTRLMRYVYMYNRGFLAFDLQTGILQSICLQQRMTHHGFPQEDYLSDVSSVQDSFYTSLTLGDFFFWDPTRGFFIASFSSTGRFIVSVCPLIPDSLLHVYNKAFFSRDSHERFCYDVFCTTQDSSL